MTTTVTINELVNLSHHDGPTVLHAKREDFEVEIRFRSEFGVPILEPNVAVETQVCRNLRENYDMVQTHYVR